jgi:hypothetical protein
MMRYSRPVLPVRARQAPCGPRTARPSGLRAQAVGAARAAKTRRSSACPTVRVRPTHIPPPFPPALPLSPCCRGAGTGAGGPGPRHEPGSRVRACPDVSQRKQRARWDQARWNRPHPVRSSVRGARDLENLAGLRVLVVNIRCSVAVVPGRLGPSTRIVGSDHDMDKNENRTRDGETDAEGQRRAERWRREEVRENKRGGEGGK